MVIDLVRLQLHDFTELLDCKLQNFRRLDSTLHVANGTKIDPAKQFAGIEVVGIALDDFLRLGDRVANVSRLEIQFGKTGI